MLVMFWSADLAASAAVLREDGIISYRALLQRRRLQRTSVSGNHCRLVEHLLVEQMIFEDVPIIRGVHRTSIGV